MAMLKSQDDKVNIVWGLVMYVCVYLDRNAGEKPWALEIKREFAVIAC